MNFVKMLSKRKLNGLLSMNVTTTISMRLALYLLGAGDVPIIVRIPNGLHLI